MEPDASVFSHLSAPLIKQCLGAWCLGFEVEVLGFQGSGSNPQGRQVL